jgi:uncharacterized protein
MKKRRIFFGRCTFGVLLLLILVNFFSLTQVKAATTYPKPTDLKYINNYTSTPIDDATKNYIVSVGKELEDKTGAQEVVVIIDSLQGNDILAYSNELFRTWGIGQKGKNNGLMILISIQDKQWKVEVGTGLGGAITDIYSARVMDGVATPKFQQGDYSGGIKDAYSLFADSIAQEYNVTLSKNEKITLPAQDTSATNNTTNLVVAGIIFFLILLDFIFNGGRITLFLMARAFFFGGRGGGNDRGGGGGFGGFGGGSSSGGGSSGRW